VGLERVPLSLVSATEELLEIKNSSSGLESREYRRRDPPRSPRGTIYPQKLTLISLASGCRSVGTVRSRAQATEFSLVSGDTRERACQGEEQKLSMNLSYKSSATRQRVVKNIYSHDGVNFKQNWSLIKAEQWKFSKLNLFSRYNQTCLSWAKWICYFPFYSDSTPSFPSSSSLNEMCYKAYHDFIPIPWVKKALHGKSNPSKRAHKKPINIQRTRNVQQ
jgi:hypothetical protein